MNFTGYFYCKHYIKHHKHIAKETSEGFAQQNERVKQYIINNPAKFAIENGTSPEKTRRVYGHYLRENSKFPYCSWANTHRVLIREIGNGIDRNVPDNGNGTVIGNGICGNATDNGNGTVIGNGIVVETQCIASLLQYNFRIFEKPNNKQRPFMIDKPKIHDPRSTICDL